MQYCGFDERSVNFIVEVSDAKYGRYTAGSLIPIVPEAEVLGANPDYLLILPWHFRSFFEQSTRLKDGN